MIYSGCNSAPEVNVVGMPIGEALNALTNLQAPAQRTITANGNVVDENYVVKAGDQIVILPASGKMGIN